MDDEWDRLPDGNVHVVLCSGFGVAVAPPQAAALRLLFVRDQAAAQAGRQESLQLALTRAQIDDLGEALREAGKALDAGETSPAG